MHGLSRSRSVWAWAALGLTGSILIALAGPAAVSAPTTPWWYMVRIPGGHGVATALVYAGCGLLCAAWLGLGRQLADADVRTLLMIGAAWLIPVALGPALFSHDAYSYLAQGTLLHLGANPYHASPAVLATSGHQHVLDAVSPFWRHVSSPYGPLFLGLMSVVVAITGSHLIGGILLIRVLDLVGVALLARFTPRLARELGASPARAIWLAVLSPLLVLQLIAAGHNDVLMAALLVAGVAVALGGRPMLGIVLCALAATFKLPALAGVVFIAVAWAREERGVAARAGLVLAGAAWAAAVLLAVSLITGLGLSWLSSTVFASPARVRLAITPATGVGFTVAGLMHDVGISVNAHGVEGVFGAVSTVITALIGLWLLSRVRIGKLALYLGGLLLIAAAGGPAAWPWYFTWGIVMLAGTPQWQRSLPLALGVVVSVFLIKPNGILALPLPLAPVVMVIYALVGALLWRWRRGGRGKGNRTEAGAEPSSAPAGATVSEPPLRVQRALTEPV
jgi:alpha-1,6-mannosyltransferase